MKAEDMDAWDKFFSAAICGICSDPSYNHTKPVPIAKNAAGIADAAIEERNKRWE